RRTRGCATDGTSRMTSRGKHSMSITTDRVVGPWQLVKDTAAHHGRRTAVVEWVGGPWDKDRIRVQSGQTTVKVTLGSATWQLPIQQGANRGGYIVWQKPEVGDFVTARIRDLLHANYYSWM